jgi:hypothetical protein
MKYTIRPKGSSSAGGFAITAIDAREALERVKELVERGVSEVQIFDSAGRAYDLAALEQQATSDCRKRDKPVNVIQPAQKILRIIARISFINIGVDHGRAGRGSVPKVRSKETCPYRKFYPLGVSGRIGP